MPPRTSETIREDVIRKYISGTTQKEIASYVGTSEANVSNIIKELKKQIDQKDIESIVTLNRKLNEERISPTQIIAAARLCGLMQKLGLDVESQNIYSFMREAYQESINQGRKPLEVIEVALKLTRLKPNDIQLEDLPNYYDDLTSKIKSSEENMSNSRAQLSLLEEQRSKLEVEVRQRLEESACTVDTLDEYRVIKKELESKGIPTSNIGKLASMLDQASKLSFDPSKIMEFLSREDMLEARQCQLEEGITGLSKKEEFLKETIKDLEDEIESKKSRIQDLENTTSQLERPIDTIRHMESQGVGPDQIIQWQRMLERSGMKVDEFEDELQKFGSLHDLIAERKLELENVENEITSNKARVKTLAKDQIKLESVINETRKNLSIHLEHITKDAINSISLVGSTSEKQIISTKDKTQKEFKEMTDTSRKDIENTMYEWKNSMIEVSKASEEIGRMTFLRSLSDMIRNSKGDPYEVYPSVMELLQNLRKWAQSQGLDYTTISAIDNLATRIKGELEKIGIPA